MQYLVTFFNRPEGGSDVVSGRYIRLIAIERFVKFGDPYLNRYGEIPPEAVGSGIFDSYFAVTSEGK